MNNKETYHFGPFRLSAERRELSAHGDPVVLGSRGFDLLLALVRRNQYPLDALPVAEITRQYDAYLREAADADMELGGDFIETASWLVLLKSRAMLPQVAGEEPAIAANSAQANTLATPSPPGTRCSQACSAE